MMRILMNAELSTSYAEWKKAYDDHKWARDEANMKEILVGWCEEDQRIHVCFEVESMEVMQKFMETHAEVIASSGHKQETTVVKILSDVQGPLTQVSLANPEEIKGISRNFILGDSCIHPDNDGIVSVIVILHLLKRMLIFS